MTEGRAVWICNAEGCSFAVPTDPIGRELMKEHLLEHDRRRRLRLVDGEFEDGDG